MFRASETGVPQDLIVIGMGKLGGRELNVSSDIDLIFFYDCDGECGPTPEYPTVRKIISNQEFYERLAKKVIPALSEIIWEGFVFRVDMRLRPNGESGMLVSSVDSFEKYQKMKTVPARGSGSISINAGSLCSRRPRHR